MIRVGWGGWGGVVQLGWLQVRWLDEAVRERQYSVGVGEGVRGEGGEEVRGREGGGG